MRVLWKLLHFACLLSIKSINCLDGRSNRAPYFIPGGDFSTFSIPENFQVGTSVYKLKGKRDFLAFDSYDLTQSLETERAKSRKKSHINYFSSLHRLYARVIHTESRRTPTDVIQKARENLKASTKGEAQEEDDEAIWSFVVAKEPLLHDLGD